MQCGGRGTPLKASGFELNMHIVLVAGGLGSRLAPLTNHIPKFLVNIGKNTGYVEQIRYWLQYGCFEDDVSITEGSPSSITVIVHSAYKDLITAYHELYFPRISLTVKTIDLHNGSAHAILSTCEHLDDKAVFFQWCDVMPGCSIPAFEMAERYCGANVVFTNCDHPNRYGLVRTGTGWADVKPELQANGRGGVFGLYYISRFHTNNITYTDGQDFVEIIEQFGPIREHALDSIVDWGDKPKLERTRETADMAREFNRVEMHGELVLKSALNEQGEALIRREIKWYDELLAVSPMFTSTPWIRRASHWPHSTAASFVMNRVKGVPVWKLWPDLDDEGRALVLNRIFEQMDLLHKHKQTVGNDVVQRDIQTEACDKLIKRYLEIKDVIDAFGPVTVVNGLSLATKNPVDVITALHEELSRCYGSTKQHSLIHGDLQMSNSMIDPDTLEVTLIDPRGYFGKSELYGVADYDYAKLLYSLSGYDLFNYSHDFHINKQGSCLNFTVPTPNLGGCAEIMRRFNYAHELWLAVCWCGLGQYIKNDPVKSVAAHYHGLALAQKLLT